MVGCKPAAALSGYGHMAHQAAGGQCRKMHLLRALRDILSPAMYENNAGPF